MKPAAVSSTKVRSRRGSSEPSRSTSPASACVMIVGITARADWRGPYVLNGRSTVTGRSCERWKLSISLSAPILEAE